MFGWILSWLDEHIAWSVRWLVCWLISLIVDLNSFFDLALALAVGDHDVHD